MIEFKNVSKTYDNKKYVLKNVDLKIEDGEFVFIVGPSGSGKTTLTKLLLREEKVTEGRIVINGFRLDKMRNGKVPYLRRTMGVVFQDFRLFPKKTVYENVAFAMQVIGASSSTIKKRVPFFLDLVGLGDKMKSFPSQLSGGEQQRVALARAIVNNPDTIIADEPTGNIDPMMSLEIMDLLAKLNEKLGKTIIVVTHEQYLVDHYKKRVITINEGGVEHDGIGGMFYDGKDYIHQANDNEENDAATETVAEDTAVESVKEPAQEIVKDFNEFDDNGNGGEA